MDMLTLNLNKDALLDLMKNFYLLTNIKIALFDLDGYEILELARTGITGLKRGIKDVTYIDESGNISDN